MTISGTQALLRRTTAVALILASTGVAAAQDAGDGFLGTVVLGEGKREVRTGTATAVTEIDRDEIDDRQAGTIAELIDSVPGVALVNGSTPQGSGINIRGFGANGTFGTDQKVAVQIDGASVGAEELYRIGTQLFTDPLLFRSVEVIRGTVGSFEYGSGIVGGAVRLETKDASDFTHGALGFAGSQTLQFSSNGAGFATSTTLAWQPIDSLELLANYSWRRQGDQEDGAGNPIGASAYELPSYLLKGRYRFGDGGDHYVSVSYSDTASADRDVPYDTFQTTAGAFGNVDRDIDSRTAALSYGWNPSGDDLIDVTATLSYADQKIDSSYVAGSSSLEGTPSFPGLLPLVEADQRYETTKLALRNVSRFDAGGMGHEVRVGLDLARKERRAAASAPGGRDERVALFAIDEVRIGDAWTLTPALRYETSTITGDAPYAGTHDADALMGGLSARYAFGGGVAVFASAAYTESLPIIDDLDNAALIALSEKARTYEVGASYDGLDVAFAGDRLAIKANLYRTTLTDVTSYSSSFGAQTDRPDRIETRGLEIEAAYGLDNGIYLDLNANITDGAEKDGGDSIRWRNMPADSVRVTLGRKFGAELDLSWEVAAAAGVHEGAQQAGGYAVHALRATYAPQDGPLEGVQMRFGIENLFDRDYTPYLSTRPAPGRNVKFTLAKAF